MTWNETRIVGRERVTDITAHHHQKEGSYHEYGRGAIPSEVTCLMIRWWIKHLETSAQAAGNVVAKQHSSTAGSS